MPAGEDGLARLVLTFGAEVSACVEMMSGALWVGDRLWLEPANAQGVSIVLFETEEEARQAAPPVGNWSAPGVTIRDVEFRRVAAVA